MDVLREISIFDIRVVWTFVIERRARQLELLRRILGVQGRFIVSKPGCCVKEVAFKDIFDLKATTVEQRGILAVNDEEDGILKKVVELFKRGNIEFSRVGWGSKDEEFIRFDELFQAGCFFERICVDENVVVSGMVAPILTAQRERVMVIRQGPSRDTNPAICQVGGYARVGVAKTQEAKFRLFTLR